MALDCEDSAGKEELEQRKRETKNSLCCPYCGERMKKWAVPQTVFTTWPNEFMYVCFNDRCSYFIRGRESMAQLGNAGSFRLMYDPLTDSCQPVPVLNRRALRDGIIEDDDETTPCIDLEEPLVIPKDAIVGTWKLVSFEQKSDDGEVSFPSGRNPSGFLSYTEDGQVTLQNMHGTGVMHSTPQGKVAALETEGAYTGSYELKGGKIVHHIKTSLFPNWTGMTQERTIRVEGNMLTLISPRYLVDGKPQTAYMTWERMD